MELNKLYQLLSFFGLYIALTLIALGCSKNDTPLMVGSWDVVEVRDRSLDGDLVSSDTFIYKLLFNNDGTGLRRNQDGTEDEIPNWELSNDKNEIKYLLDVVSSTGQQFTSTKYYDVVVYEKDYQEWENSLKTILPSNGKVHDDLHTVVLTRIK